MEIEMAFNISGNRNKYDVIIVGSDAGGEMVGYVLAPVLEALMLESGPFFDPAKDSLPLRWPRESPRRGTSTRAFGDFDGPQMSSGNIN